VARLSSCLDELPTGQRRVLVLRAGVGAAHAHSQRAVARTLDITVRRVRRLERSGLRHARALSRADACGGTASSRTMATTTGSIATAGGGSGTGTTGGAPAIGDHSTGGQDGARGPAPEDEGDVRGESNTRVSPHSPGPVATAGGVALALAIALFALAALAGYATPHLRGRLRSN
jgi:hypothetical protein